MCISPSSTIVPLPKNEGTQFIELPCRDCWQCRANKFNDIVGRCLAEASFATQAVALTLTYADQDDLSHLVITPSHFQNFIKALRVTVTRKNKNARIRYLVAGEYGSLKGRAHFHAILFFYGVELDIWKQRVRENAKYWNFGFTFADYAVDEKAIRYVCKYLLKDYHKNDANAQAWVSYSKKPPLGDQFFSQLAARAVEYENIPDSLEYIPPFGDTNRKYVMTGATRRNFIYRVVAGLRQKSGGWVHPYEARLHHWLQNSVDKADRWMIERELTDAEKRLSLDDDVERLRQTLAYEQPAAQRRADRELMNMQAEHQQEEDRKYEAALAYVKTYYSELDDWV